MDISSKFLTVVLFLNCLFLILLVLVQLPRKRPDSAPPLAVVPPTPSLVPVPAPLYPS